ncbi:MAG: sigma 54-interacting transcriptional regulator [Myxococcales bacterium]|nr:sigma 54-interacting transcriptional regulator [Myxococcales bacterium]
MPSGAPLDDDLTQAVTTVFDRGRAMVRHLRKSRLVVTAGVDQGRDVVLDKPRMTGGRSTVNDICLSDKAVSGTHFEILAEENGFRLRDLDSTNGTFVGDLRIKDIYLRPGTRFRVGHSELSFVPQDDFVDIPLSDSDLFGELIGGSVRMREIFALLEKIAPTDLRVLITGETGTGKEMVARALHQASPRRDRPLVVLDCGAIPRELTESTLFGHEKGAFTGAVQQHRGVFEQAQGGTLLLDEIGELPLELQPKLLRVLENQELKRVGGDRVIKIDVRVLAATHRDLRLMVSAGTFREDLYFRLSVITVELPPLRERREDIPRLAEHFLRPIAARRKMNMSFSAEALRLLSSHPLPGNVRELRNIVERAAALCDGPVIERRDILFHRDGWPRLPGLTLPPVPAGVSREKDGRTLSLCIERGLEFKEAKQRVVDAFELAYLQDLLERNGANITRSAAEAGLTRYHLRELLKRHNLAGRCQED